jgi:hypothetical protein
VATYLVSVEVVVVVIVVQMKKEFKDKMMLLEKVLQTNFMRVS